MRFGVGHGAGSWSSLSRMASSEHTESQCLPAVLEMFSRPCSPPARIHARWPAIGSA